MGAENIRLGRLVPGNPDEMIVPTRQVFAMVDELETLREKVKPVNAAAMREALEGIIENLSTRIKLGRGNRVTMPVGEAKCLVGYARAAIAATPEPPLNAAELREALEDSQSLLESFSRGEYGSQVREQMRDNRAALVAPARNIDAIPEDELVRAFKRDNCDQYENSSEDQRTCCEGRCVECIVKWMIKQHEIAAQMLSVRLEQQKKDETK